MLALALLACGQGAATANETSIGLYADPLGESCVLEASLGESATIYIIAHLGSDLRGAIAAVEFSVQGTGAGPGGFPAGWNPVFTDRLPTGVAIDGNINTHGVRIVFNACLTSPVLLYEVTLTPSTEEVDVVLRIDQRFPPTNMAVPHPNMDAASCGTGSLYHELPRTQMIINPTQPYTCPEVVTLETRTWSNIKNLYAR